MRPRIEIGQGRYLLYLVLPHEMKMALLTPASRGRLDAINQSVNSTRYSGEGARDYDRQHAYDDEAVQHEYPASLLIDRVWAPDGYGRALELGAGSGYFTARIARRARSVVAVEPVRDLQDVLRARVATAGLDNVEVLDGTADALDRRFPPASFDSALVIQSLHHFHRRPDVLAMLGRVVRPGGRLFLLEPHHNVKRVGRLLLKYARAYRAPSFWSRDSAWATHDFLTRGEVLRLCRHGGFDDVRIRGYWMPYTRRAVPDPRRRFSLEDAIGRVPGLRHLAAVLAVEARRTGA